MRQEKSWRLFDGNTWRHLGKFYGRRAAVDIPWPSVVFVPQYFHFWEEGPVADSSSNIFPNTLLLSHHKTLQEP